MKIWAGPKLLCTECPAFLQAADGMQPLKMRAALCPMISDIGKCVIRALPSLPCRTFWHPRHRGRLPVATTKTKQGEKDEQKYFAWTI